MTGNSATAEPEPSPGPILVLDGKPPTRRAWLSSMVDFWPVQIALARKDFKARYKAASLGVAWSVIMPLIQASVLAFIFSLAFRGGLGVDNYAAFVVSGMLGWTYLLSSVTPATTAIVDGASLTDKVWFPRVLLVLATPLANLVGLVVTYVAVIVALYPLGVDYRPRLLLLPLALLLLVLFTLSLSAVFAAMNVYFRDTKFIVQALFMVWMYVTPILYPTRVLGRWAGWLDVNPMTGIVTFIRVATVGTDHWQRPLIVSCVVTLLLCLLAIDLHRRHDRRFVDLL